MLLALIAPALWNRFPLVFYDTGGYLARPFEHTLLIGRSAFYGAFLAAGAPALFWPNIVVQAVLVIWLVGRTLAVHRITGIGRLTAIVIGLCLLTGLPWYTAQLMPDILVPAAVLALYLLSYHAAKISRLERWALVTVGACAIASHMSILGLFAGLVLCLAVLRQIPTTRSPQASHLAWPALTLAAGIVLALASNAVIGGRMAFTPGGWNIAFSRMVQDGMAARYLEEHCPDPTLRICSYRDRLPDDGADWLWDEDSPLRELGNFDAFEPEAKRIVLASIMDHPFLQLQAAIEGTLAQILKVQTARGLEPWNWHVQWTLERFAPRALPAYLAARQAQAPFDFSVMNAVHVPVALAAMLLLPVIVLLGYRRRLDPDTANFALIVLLALMGNAVICGMISMSDDRYQSRLIWLAPLAVVMAAIDLRRRTV